MPVVYYDFINISLEVSNKTLGLSILPHIWIMIEGLLLIIRESNEDLRFLYLFQDTTKNAEHELMEITSKYWYTVTNKIIKLVIVDFPISLESCNEIRHQSVEGSCSIQVDLHSTQTTNLYAPKLSVYRGISSFT